MFVQKDRRSWVRQHFAKECCKKDCLGATIVWEDLLGVFDRYHSKSENDRESDLLEKLRASHVPRNLDGSHAKDHLHHICENDFDFRHHGKPICAHAFAALVMLSCNTLRKLAKSLDLLPPTHGNAALFKPRKQSKVTEVQLMVQSLIEVQGTPHPTQKDRIHLHGYYSKEAIRQDIPRLIGEEYIISHTSFSRMWKQHFPRVLLEEDRPGCEICIQIDTALHRHHEALGLLDRDALQKEREQHLARANALTNVSLKAQQDAHILSGVQSICIDFMAKKCVPKGLRHSTISERVKPLVVSTAALLHK